ncbi:MAG: fimbrillin family protein [Mediterranea sp.]|nr:fimbrillin family protein [Mediterranea sp.]
MMKGSYLALAFASLLFAGCDNDIKEGDYKFAGDQGTKVTFSAVVNPQGDDNLNGSTRVSGVTWETGDSLGITCGPKQVNIQYRYEGPETHAFYAVDNTHEVWLLGSEEYAVSAYYPYMGSDGVELAAQQVVTSSENNATEEGRAKLDFLYASATANRDNPNVQLTFNHKMSRVMLTFQADAGVELTDIDCYIVGTRQHGTINPNTGAVALDEMDPESTDENPIPQKPRDLNQVLTAANNYTFTAILFPQTLTERVLLIEAGMRGIYYKVEIPLADLPELKGGYSYNYTVTAKNYSNEPIVLELTGSEIMPWNNQDGGTFVPEPSPAGTDAGANPPSWGDIPTETITPTVKP